MTIIWIHAIYVHITLIHLAVIILYRFIDADGNNYNPTRTVTGPYGSTNIFTGPKVQPITSYNSLYSHCMVNFSVDSGIC